MGNDLILPKILFHEHAFSNDFVPKNFMPFALVRFLMKNGRGEKLAKYLHDICKHSDDDIFDKYGNFIGTGCLVGGQHAIIEQMLLNQPEDTHFVILPMDMNYMKRGKSKKSYDYQLDELIEIKQEYGERMHIFFMADPRNQDLKKIYQKTEWSGIKIYPLLGYYPQDKGLDWIYADANEKGLSVISHCTRENAVYYSGKDIDSRLLEYNPRAYTKGRNKKLVYQFAHPTNFIELANKYRNINWVLAHMGGYESVRDNNGFYKWLYTLCQEHSNIYTDTSFSAAFDFVHQEILKWMNHVILKDKIIGGTDFYMNETVTTEQDEFSSQLESVIGKEHYYKLFHLNARPLLNLEVAA